MDLILASQSPRRKELLSLIQPEFRVIPSNAEEIIPDGLLPHEAVMHLAKLKAGQLSQVYPESIVIGADTVVVIDGKILGKPKDKEDCKRMLHLLSGRTHQVHTGVAIVKNGTAESFYASTDVTFLSLTEEEIEWYSSTPEPYDKAGAYGIQGLGSLLIQGICGDYYNVMGLPVSLLNRKLREF